MSGTVLAFSRTKSHSTSIDVTHSRGSNASDTIVIRHRVSNGHRSGDDQLRRDGETSVMALDNILDYNSRFIFGYRDERHSGLTIFTRRESRSRFEESRTQLPQDRVKAPRHLPSDKLLPQNEAL